MIISNPNSPTISHGAIKTYAVDISKGAGRFVVFDTLIDGLYKNKIRIVIQEYSSNARDANIEAGTPDRPIEVQLPTSDIPKFAVRDFGPGISPDRMADVFCNLGESTKRDGNAQTGGFGLGAKCGYAYAKLSTGKFRIITVFGSTKYSYVAYINDGAPYIDLVDEEPTSEPTGTTIVMDVKAFHVSEFINHALDIYKHWPVRPIFHGKQLDFTPFDQSISHHEDGIKLIDKNRRAMTFTIAGIPYTPPSTYYGGVSAIIELPNGAVSLTRSREDIESTDANKTVLESYIEKARKISRRLASEKLKDCKNIFEAYLTASTIWHDSELKFADTAITSVSFSVGSTKTSIQTSTKRIDLATSVFGSRRFDDNLIVIWKDNNSIKNILSRIDRYVSENPTKLVVYVGGRSEVIDPLRAKYFSNAIKLSELPVEETVKVKVAKAKVEPSCQCLEFNESNYEIEKTKYISEIDKSALYFVYSKVETTDGMRSNMAFFHKKAELLKMLKEHGKTVIGFPRSFAHVPEKLGLSSLDSYISLIITARKASLDADRRLYNTINHLGSKFGANSWKGVELKKVVNAPEKFKRAVSLIDSIEMYLYSRIIPQESRITDMDEDFLKKYKSLIYMSADKFSSITELENVLFGGHDA